MLDLCFAVRQNAYHVEPGAGDIRGVYNLAWAQFGIGRETKEARIHYRGDAVRQRLNNSYLQTGMKRLHLVKKQLSLISAKRGLFCVLWVAQRPWFFVCAHTKF